MRNVRKYLNEMKGVSLTSQRKFLIELIRKAEGHISAKELYKLAVKKNESISLATVYRNLKLFKDIGIIEERQFGKLYCYYELKQAHSHQHVVCKHCGNVIEFETPLLQKIVEHVENNYSFNVVKAEIFLEGYCKECNNGESNIERKYRIG
ncbi:MAG: Fur family transcriptional regulator [Thermodesulfobacteriota bacterium]|nr:Fur family transcriptional regulator [Thermodesulfobacteriota bacterium]